MTLEEIVKQEGRQPDCSGYVTKYDIECSDGLTIRPGAFDDDNGRRVPMVWMHDHKDMENVLGHIYLESRGDGVYGYGFFNDSPKGQLGKLYVDHGDISSFSIYANKLKKKARDVVHGMIREVSLVLAGANRGALIDSPISHSDQDEDEGEGVICMGDDYGGPIYGNDEPLSVEEYLEHYGRKGMKWGKNLFKTEYEAHPREKGEEEETNSGRSLGESDSDQNTKRLTDELLKNSGVDWTKYVGKDWMMQGPESAVRSIAENLILAKANNWGEKTLFNYFAKLGIDDRDASKIIKSFDNTITTMKEEKAKEALPNTPGMNAKPSEKKEGSEPESDNTHGLKSREKQVTGEGKKIETKGESLTVEKLKEDYPYLKPYSEWVLTGENSICAYGLHSLWDTIGRIGIEEGLKDDVNGIYARRDESGRSMVDILKDFEQIYDNDTNFLYNVVTDKDSIEARAYRFANEISDNLYYIYAGLKANSKTADEDFKKLVDDLVKTYPALTSVANLVLDQYFGERPYDPKRKSGKKKKEGSKFIFSSEPTLGEKYQLTEKVKHSEEKNMDDILEHAENEGGKTVREVFNDMSDEQQSLVFYFLKKARQLIDDGEIKHSEKEEDEMKHNVFDDAKETKENTLSHDDMEKLEADVFKDAKSKGSLKDSFLAHAGDYGIDDIEYLFPDDRKVTNTPTWIKRPDGWVSKVMKGVSHSPFSRIKSIFADITEPDARARGYVKGNRKVEEVFGLLKRSTTPTTVYKKQKLDRDDIIDITDFDVVSWLKTEMRGMLDEELARAFLIGDGRSAASSDKINEQNIRPIYSDDDLFVIRKAIAVTSSTTTDEKCKQFIRTCIKARKDYRGSGNPTLFTTEDMLTDLLLMEDQIGHTLYDSADKLATKLRVKEIITVPVFENQTRISGSATLELMGIIVNLDDYKVGADKGGSVSMFEDFDIDYNQEKYLIETRCSGALTVPYSAIVIESTASVYLDVEADDPSETRYGKTVSTLQSDIVINDDSISGTLNYVTGYTGYSGDTDLQSGYYIALKLDVPNGATTTIAALNNGGSGTPVDLGSDDYAVGRITTKNAKIVISTTLAGVTVSKTYSLRLLKFGPKS